MIVLGITNNDLAGACIVRDGEIVAAVSEERFSRIKDHSTWPEQSIAYVLREAGVSLSEVDRVAYGWCAGFDMDKHLLLYVDRISEEALARPEALPHLRKRIADEMRNDKPKRGEFDAFVDEHGLRDRTVYVDHHESHGLGAFLCSPFDDALVVTCDGRGDFQSLTVTRYSPEGEEVLRRETSIDSLGYFYGRITKLLGYKPNRHEGKITGLAANGDPEKLLPLMRKMIDIEEGGALRARCGDFYQPSYNGYSDVLLAEIAKHSPADVAAAAQRHIENLLTAIVAQHIDQVPSGNVCLSGGVFANVKLNQRIFETAGVSNVYVLPPMGDGGLPLQTAVIVDHREEGKRPRVPSMALGPESAISEGQLEEILRDYPDLKFRRVGEGLQEELLDALANDRVVGLYRGRMEFGPRSLGRRSVVYSTHDVTMNDWLNKRLNRTEFMPFAPITAMELAEDCYVGWAPDQPSALFMTITYPCHEKFAVTCPAVVHTDNTARPQIVRREDDPFLHSLLMGWHERSGQAALVNTSFNKHEEPIVGSHRDALDPLQDDVIDLLLIDDVYLVHKAL
ncbi:carbamoyltransferase C-terminal domain-containing protein [Streptomyces sp. SL13]|uniref:Carbamoyltransferase C-terminal domain-containing protein n=1 Tax=Streptantibioticus silvisoli TaxID=2705255 RepID=A0AA90K9S8_9ACTN|nr:carbamoyltransferase C-terminal domain-containing protein [Streptantibioticus silvisoli]MDI5965625.1 carbamoyltransferase C-terminal domain-containing protein [Streptantibioticus silvisoli]MDI5971578.1 carbamoyltransferase C-terminal domain-containing protein [Streptantibioticus silvisoli]